MPIFNIAGYKFTPLEELPDLGEQLLMRCNSLSIKGTILLSPEGINLSLAGIPESIVSFQNELQKDERFQDMTYRESFSEFEPFKQMKVKIKKEIITMKRDEVRPENVQRAPSLTPQEFKQWLDENRDITILDTRNDYEVRFGTFRNAINLKIEDFSDFPEIAEKAISPTKPVVMFCTGGIRCEKAAIHLQNAGFSDVYQLHGGILNYFAEVGGDYYDGECFVFDQRVSLNSNLEVTGTEQCLSCEGPIKPSTSCAYCE